MAENGKEDQARGVWREQDPLRVHADGDNIGEDRRDGCPDGSESERSNRENFSTANTREGEANPGKILSQLEAIRAAHLAYINAHTDRLRARLAEDEEHRSKIITDIDELREQIILKMRSEASNEET